ncbi:MAG: magnesium and cobalt transport protein CorA [Gammaproteobacteria bacterium RIFCSPHIGHO2_12_FULL_37_14]|nr:MAG: magnesium and cobalt transport protein CorA [Gammaproteobacteria bacterium RIFCSPHIGHO2_12_FULL_37_14]
MIITYLSEKKLKPETITMDNQAALNSALWVDLLNPTKEEEVWVESTLCLDIPTREEMQEIELSSRLYEENGALFMTVTMVAKSTSPEPTSDAVTLILTKTKLITVRYIEPHSFSLFTSYMAKLPLQSHNANALLVELLDASIDRLADILENVSSQLDNYSNVIFHSELNEKYSKKTDYKTLLQRIGASGDLNTKVQESLISFNRLMIFFGKKYSSEFDSSIQSKLTMIADDTKSLKDHVTFLSNKVNFLLDATLGMVNIEQNNIIKIFSIAAVILLPPTLVASVYGMNFEFMPELKWHWGYPFAIMLMLISAWLPYKYFKLKKWL